MKKILSFEIDDIFETHDGILWRVCGVEHDKEIVYGYNEQDTLNDVKFTFTDVINKWTKEKQE